MIIKYLNNAFITFCLLLSSININANPNKTFDRYEISILSIGEGPSLVDAFGHTAIRVKDSELKNDVVFNFGVYDFNSPNFYSNFVKGRPEYKLAIQNYNNLIQNYIRQKRYIVEHQLNLDQNSTKIIIDLLVEKLNDPYYIYDYFRDNCTTRAADIVIDKTNNKFKDDKLESEAILTYRDLIHRKINENSRLRSKINILTLRYITKCCNT